MRQGLDLPNLVSELEFMYENRRDFLVNTKSIKILPPGPDQPVQIQFKRPTYQACHFPMTTHMLTQLSGYTGIPIKLIETVLEKGTEREQRALCRLMTVRLKDNEAIRLLRTQQAFYGEPMARAFVSDRYREIDNWPLAQTIIPILQSQPNLKLVSADITDTNMYLKIINTDLSGDVGTTLDKKGKQVGDVLQFGVIVINSEVGASSVRIVPFIYRLACLNGMVVMQTAGVIKRNHVGKKLKGLSGEDVTKKDDPTNDDLLAQISTLVSTMLKDTALAKSLTEKFKRSKKDIIQGHAEAVMNAIGERYGLTQAEVKTMTKYLITNGDMNRFGVINAITQYASLNRSIDYDRVTELEAIGGQILEMPSVPTWKVFGSKRLVSVEVEELMAKRAKTTKAVKPK